jgi:hypothetical protein
MVLSSLIELQARKLHFANVKESLQRYREERVEEIKEQILRIVRIYGVKGCGVLPGKLADMIGFNKKKYTAISQHAGREEGNTKGQPAGTVLSNR